MVKSGNTTGAIAWVDTDESFSIWSPLAVMRANPDKLLPRFLFHYTNSQPFQTSIMLACSYGTQPNIGMGVIEQQLVVVPSLDEQLSISAFLDREIAKIDTLIAKQEQLIALLQEKRQALISHAVTKGLNPDAPMKDSGVEWLGDVPAHWSMKRLRHISPQLLVGVVVNPSSYITDAGVPFLYGSNVSEGGISLDGCRHIPPQVSDNELAKSRLNAEDLVTVRVGYPGVTAVVPPELEGANCASMMIIRRAPHFNSHWLAFAMNSYLGRQQVQLVQYGAAQEQFNISHAVDFRFPVPPLSEQTEIVEYLERSSSEIRRLTDLAESTTVRLHERRAALISAAVTGKIDVRNLAN